MMESSSHKEWLDSSENRDVPTEQRVRGEERGRLGNQSFQPWGEKGRCKTLQDKSDNRLLIVVSLLDMENRPPPSEPGCVLKSKGVLSSRDISSPVIYLHPSSARPQPGPSSKPCRFGMCGGHASTELLTLPSAVYACLYDGFQPTTQIVTVSAKLLGKPHAHGAPKGEILSRFHESPHAVGTSGSPGG